MRVRLVWTGQTRWLCFVLLIVATVGGMALDASPAGKALAPHADTIFAVLIGTVSLLSLRLLTRERSLTNYLLICVPYFMISFKFLISPVLPYWDSYWLKYPTFKYIADAVAQGCIFPQWFSTSGGVRTGIYHVNLYTTLPHTLLIYYLYSVLHLSTVFAFKLQLILGLIIVGFGWWLVLSKVTDCQYASYFGTLMILMGGTGIAFHCSHVVPTTYLIPWLVLSILKLKENHWYIFPAVTLFGFGIATFYPHIQILSMGLFIVIMACFYPVVLKDLFRKKIRSAFDLMIPLALLGLFILALLPSVYLFQNIGNLSSKMRAAAMEEGGVENYFFPQTYDEYARLISCAGGGGNHPVSYLYQYITPIKFMRGSQWLDKDRKEGLAIDRSTFFVGRIALVFAIIGIFSQLRKSAPIVILLICFTLLYLGVRGGFAKFLFLIRFPFIASFRQYILFFPMINFCLSALAALGLAAFIRYSQKKATRVFSMLAVLMIFLQTVDLAIYDKKYLSAYSMDASGTLRLKQRPVPTNREVDHRLAENFFTKRDYGIIEQFQYKDRYKLYSSCPEAIPTTPFLTSEIVSVTGGVDMEREEVCRIFSEGKEATVANIPPAVLSTSIGPLKGRHPAKCDGCVRTDGLYFDLSAPEAALFVVPLNYSLKTRAYIDGAEATVWRINSALSGILVKKGYHRVEFKIPGDAYLPMVLIQCLLYIFVAVFFITNAFRKKYRRKRP